MPTSDFLTPHPPTLLRVSESQAFSSSSTSLSSRCSSYFDQVSRSSSSYMTDITPPISPASGGRYPSAGTFKAGRADQQQNISQDECASLLRSLSNLDEDLGYASDREQDDGDFDAVEALRSRLMRNKPTIKTKRALKIIEKRGRHGSSPIVDGEGVWTPVMPTKVVVTEVKAPVEDWSDDFELGECDNQVEVRVESVESDSDTKYATETVPAEKPREQDIASPFLVDISPIIPPKPILQPIDQEWDGSSFSLYSPGLSSSASVSVSISLSQISLSPFQLEASSPTVFEAPGHEVLHFSSPAPGISNAIFGSRRSRQPLPVSSLDQSLDLPTLMRLEIASSLEQQTNQPTPNRPLVGLGFEVPVREPNPELPPTPLSPEWVPPRELVPIPSLGAPADLWQTTSCEDRATSLISEEARVRGEVDGDPIASLTLSHPVAEPLCRSEGDSYFPALSDVVPTQPRPDTFTEASDGYASTSAKAPVIGLGLGSSTERTLQSSSSISQLCQESPVTAAGLHNPSGLSQQISVGLDPHPTSANDVVTSSVAQPHSSPLSDVLRCVDPRYTSRIPSNATGSLNGGCPSEIEPSGVLSDQDSSKKTFGVPEMTQDHINNAIIHSSCVSPSEIEPLGVLLGVNGLLGSTSLSSTSFHNILSEFPQPPPLHHHLIPLPINPTHNEVPLLSSPNAHSEQTLLTLHVDPRSPCPNSRNDFAVAVEPRDASQAMEYAPPPPPLACVPFPGYDPPDPLNSDGPLRSSKSAEGLGIGLPSDLAAQPPRQRSISSHGRPDSLQARMSTAESCQNLAQLASEPSPTSYPSFNTSSPSSPSPWNFLRIRQFTKRHLYAIPEIRTPSPNPSRRRFSPTGLLSPIINRLRSPKLYTPWFKSPMSTSPESFDAPIPRNVDLSPLAAMSPHSAPPSPSGRSLFPRLMSRSPLSASSLSPSPRLSAIVTSPPLVEHLDAPKGLEIFRRASPSSTSPKTKATSRLRPPRRFRHLF